MHLFSVVVYFCRTSFLNEAGSEWKNMTQMCALIGPSSLILCCSDFLPYLNSLQDVRLFRAEIVSRFSVVQKYSTQCFALNILSMNIFALNFLNPDTVRCTDMKKVWSLPLEVYFHFGATQGRLRGVTICCGSLGRKE